MISRIKRAPTGTRVSNRTIQTQRSFTHALMELMRQYPYKDITVKEIVTKAGRTRQTFYRHFTSKQDVLTRHLEVLYQQCYDEIADSKTTDMEEALRIYFNFWYQFRDVVQQLYERENDSLLRDLTLQYALKLYPLIKRFMRHNFTDKSDECYFQQFIFGGLVQMKMQWFLNGCDVPPNEMARKLTIFWRETL